jgi:MraZ protein
VARLKGRQDGSVDLKGRVSIPSKWRKLLPEELVVAKHPKKEQPALVVYSEEGFDAWFESLLEAKGGARANDAAQDELEDEFYQDAADVAPDGLGRITIPAFLREYAGIERDVIITGARDHLIMRTPDALDKARNSFASNSVYDKPASDVAEQDR